MIFRQTRCYKIELRLRKHHIEIGMSTNLNKKVGYSTVKDRYLENVEISWWILCYACPKQKFHFVEIGMEFNENNFVSLSKRFQTTFWTAVWNRALKQNKSWFPVMDCPIFEIGHYFKMSCERNLYSKSRFYKK